MKLTQRLAPVQAQTQKQSLKISPKLIQQFKLFQLPYAELAETLQKEADENIMLEVIRYDQLVGPSGKRQNTDSPATDWQDTHSLAKTLKDHLFSQLDTAYLSPKEHEIAEFLIDELDERGFLPHFSEVREDCTKRFSVAPRKVFDILKIIQTFEPEGVGARSVEESLLIQIEQHDFKDERLQTLLTTVITSCFSKLDDPDYVAKQLGLPLSGVLALIDFIKQNLTPNPGLNFASDTLNRHIIPSFEAWVTDGKLHLTSLEETQGIQVGLSKANLALLADPKTDSQTKAFLQDKLDRASLMIDAIETRQQTSLKIISFILERQKAFLTHGPLHLEPLLQKEISETLNLTASTVSRLVTQKYVQTPHGLFLLKALCPRSFHGKTSVRLSQLVVQELKKNPHASDAQITDFLMQQGIPLARRTITKYRLASGIKDMYHRPKP